MSRWRAKTRILCFNMNNTYVAVQSHCFMLGLAIRSRANTYVKS